MRKLGLWVVVVLFSLTLVNAAENCSLSNNITITNYNNLTLIYIPQTNITVTVTGITSTNIYSPNQEINISINNELNITSVTNLYSNTTINLENNITNIVTNNVNISISANFTNIFTPSISNNANVEYNITNVYHINITDRGTHTFTCPTIPAHGAHTCPTIPACPACPQQVCSPHFNITCPGGVLSGIPATPVVTKSVTEDWLLYAILAVVGVFIFKAWKQGEQKKEEPPQEDLPGSDVGDFPPERKRDHFSLAHNSLSSFDKRR